MMVLGGGTATVTLAMSERMLHQLLLRADRWLRVLALVLAIVCLGLATFALIAGGAEAFGRDGRSWTLTGPASAVIAAPVFTLAATLAYRSRTRAAGMLLSAGILWLVLAGGVTGGPDSSLWFLYPLLTLLVGLGLGMGPGLTSTLVGMTAYMLVAQRHEGTLIGGMDVWAHSTAVTAAFAGIGLIGVWLHGVLKSGLRGLDLESRDERERLLRHAMRVETVGDLASMVAHQLRNRLQVMNGHIALGATEDAEEKDARFAIIRGEIDASTGLLEQLLQLVHPDEGDPVRVDLVPLCAEFCDSVRTILPSSIAFGAQLPRHPVTVVLEPRGLEHALLNLVINARHAIEGPGTLTLSVGEGKGVAYVEVTDTGAGIAAGDLARVFEPYFTTKPRGEGTGLGLAAVERYVHASSGEVEVQSEVGRGTKFRLEFPLASLAPE